MIEWLLKWLRGKPVPKYLSGKTDAINCPWCREWTGTTHINGSEKCPRCKTVEDCCNGEQANEPNKPRKDDTVLDADRNETSNTIVSWPI